MFFSMQQQLSIPLEMYKIKPSWRQNLILTACITVNADYSSPTQIRQINFMFYNVNRNTLGKPDIRMFYFS